MKQQSRSPAKEAIGIVPFLGLIEIEALKPALFRFGGVERCVESREDGGTAGDAQVGKQPCQDERGAAIRALEIGLLCRVEFPGNDLAEDGVGVVSNGEHTIAGGSRARGDQR